MTWQRRLIELVCAGGALTAIPACGIPGGVPCGNANPDPCICGRMPADSPTCKAEAACEHEGGYFDPFDPAPAGVDAGAGVQGHCVLPGDDAGVPDARLPDAGPGPLPDAMLADAPKD